MRKTYYTAVGHFRRSRDSGGQNYPVILVNRQEHRMDPQEMALWTALNWRLLDYDGVEREYDRLALGSGVQEYRPLRGCLERLVVRGLVVSGDGETDFEALYDLLGGLYIVPLTENLPLRLLTFLKLTVLEGVPIATAKVLFQRDRPSEMEAQVMALARQELMSTAELVKCAEVGVTDVSTAEKLMAALYDDADTTSDNLPARMRRAGKCQSVTMAVANLYLRKRIIFQRV